MNAARFVDLVEMTRKPAPPSYELTPKNRHQRRGLAKRLKRLREGPRP